MSFLERINNKVQAWRRRPDIHAAPDATLERIGEATHAVQPDTIDLTHHPLRPYPGFNYFAHDWNTYAVSPTRVVTQQVIADAQRELGQLDAAYDKEAPALERELTERTWDRNDVEYVFHASENKQEKRGQLKRVRKERRQAMEALEQFRGQQGKARKKVEAIQRKAEASLKASDYEFAFGGDEERLIFYAADRVGGVVSEVDEVLAAFAQHKRLTFRELRNVNFSLISIQQYYLPDASRLPIGSELWPLAEEAARRQMTLLNQ